MILAVVPDVSSLFFAGVLAGIESKALEAGYRLLLGVTHGERRREEDYVLLARQRAVDGALFASVSGGQAVYTRLAERTPVVLACQYPSEASFPVVSIDNVRAVADAVTYLIGLGHRRIGHITGPSNLTVTRDRVDGYGLALEAHGIAVDPRLIREGDFHFASGYSSTEALLQLDPRPTAILAHSDEMAMGAVRAIQRAGVRVPTDISVIGFDDTWLASSFDVPLTTVAQPMGEIGYKAAELLIALIKGGDCEAKHLKVPHRLVVRESSGPAPR